MGPMMYLAEKVVEYFEDFDSFLEWLRKFERAGLLRVGVINRESKYISIAGKVTVLLYRGVDPINVLVLLGLAFYGPYWVEMPDRDEAFEYIKKWWREKMKKEGEVKRNA